MENQISQIAAFNTDLNISELETVCHHCKTYQLSEIQIVFSPKYNLYFITLDMSETVFRAFCVAKKWNNVYEDVAHDGDGDVAHDSDGDFAYDGDVCDVLPFGALRCNRNCLG